MKKEGNTLTEKDVGKLPRYFCEAYEGFAFKILMILGMLHANTEKTVEDKHDL